MRRPIAAIAALLLIVPGVAQAAEAPCLSPGEFAALAEYALPSVITGTSQRCSTQLPAGAYLPREGTRLAGRYAQRRPAAWPGAKAAFLKLSASTNADANTLIRTLPDASLQQMLASLLEGMVAQQIPLDRCTAIDRLIGLLSPLPAQSTAEAIALAVGLGAKTGRAKFGAISVCPV
jgi:hypothetical protein